MQVLVHIMLIKKLCRNFQNRYYFVIINKVIFSLN
ncbi:MAG: hypothetical protein JWP69_949 [Flaviaesturariibacter sp.]|nr:hypothetical protein [Flaviaesturariibacter sp.]